jgi:transposase
MPGRSLSVLDVEELVRRLRSGQRVRAIARDLGIDRKTVARYRQAALEQDWLTGEMPALEVIHEVVARSGRKPAPYHGSSVEPFRALVEEWMGKRLEGRAIHGLLQERGFLGSYSAVRRFLRSQARQSPEVFLRIEVPPGREAQVDFGYAGMIHDPVLGRARKAWLFAMVLSHSRHLYVELVWDQSVGTWLSLHRRAFEFFGGVVESVVLDNLKAGILKACQKDPEVQRSYRDFATHYGFLIRPCRPRTPEHKGKVESGVHYVKRNCLAGRIFTSLADGNAHVTRWVMEVAGRRIHGTTQCKPLEVFEAVEQRALRSLPAERYELTVWKRAKVQTDSYLNFERSYYSTPYRLVGKELWVKGTPSLVQIYDQFELVATHVAAKRPGTRVFLEDHFPPEKRAYLEQTAEWCLAEARRVGPSTLEVVEALLAERPSDRLPAVQGILRLRKKYSAARVNSACQRVLDFGELKYQTIRRILEQGLESSGPVPSRAPAAPIPPLSPPRFARSWREFFPGPGEGEEKCPPKPN